MTASDIHLGRTTGGRIARSAVGRSRGLPWALVATSIAALDAAFILALATTIGHIYYILTYNDPTNLDTHLRLGAMMALLVVGASAMTGGYRMVPLVHQRFRATRIAIAFLVGVAMLVMILFLAKSSHNYSRSVVTITLGAGLPLMLVLRYVEILVLRRLSRAGRLDAQRLLLVGDPARIEQIADDRRLARHGLSLGGRAALSLRSGMPGFDAELAEAVAAGRRTNPDGIVICLPWAERDTVETVIASLAELPAAIYLDGDPYLRSLSAGRDGPFDSPVGIQVIGRPFSQASLAAKRGFDILVSAAAILLASPVMLLVALAVRLDSPGPVLFQQQRYGYNRTPFRIHKFRTMRHDHGAGFRQAERNDARITRIGAFLRKTNLDELPQLFNVLAGDMSLVGPRPHPMELDDQFSPLIDHYSRRHRVRPGITGWAQVNGFRGETDTTEKMQGRIAYDLHYLNNWSFWLDLRILLMTVLSATAYRNAF